METAERVTDRWEVSDPTGIRLADRLGSATLISCAPSRGLQTRRSIKSTESENIDPNRMTGQKRCKVRCKVTEILGGSSVQLIENNGEPGGARTRDHRIKRKMLPVSHVLMEPSCE